MSMLADLPAGHKSFGQPPRDDLHAYRRWFGKLAKLVLKGEELEAFGADLCCLDMATDSTYYSLPKLVKASQGTLKLHGKNGNAVTVPGADKFGLPVIRTYSTRKNAGTDRVMDGRNAIVARGLGTLTWRDDTRTWQMQYDIERMLELAEAAPVERRVCAGPRCSKKLPVAAHWRTTYCGNACRQKAKRARTCDTQTSDTQRHAETGIRHASFGMGDTQISGVRHANFPLFNTPNGVSLRDARLRPEKTSTLSSSSARCAGQNDDDVVNDVVLSRPAGEGNDLASTSSSSAGSNVPRCPSAAGAASGRSLGSGENRGGCFTPEQCQVLRDIWPDLNLRAFARRVRDLGLEDEIWDILADFNDGLLDGFDPDKLRPAGMYEFLPNMAEARRTRLVTEASDAAYDAIMDQARALLAQAVDADSDEAAKDSLDEARWLAREHDLDISDELAEARKARKERQDQAETARWEQATLDLLVSRE